MTVECSRLRRSRSSLTKCARCSVAEEHSTFIFVAFLAQSRPTSRRQSSRRAPRAAKQVLEFLSASFGANKFAVHLVSDFSARTNNTIDHLTNPLGANISPHAVPQIGARNPNPSFLWHRTHLFFS